MADLSRPTHNVASAARASARGRLDAAGVVVLRRRRCRARARADLRAVVAVRRPRRARRRAGLLHGDAGRPHPDRRHARPRRSAPGVRQRLPPPRLRDRARQRLPRDAAVPVPRVDVRARRLAASAPLARSARRDSIRPTSRCCRSSVDTWGPFLFVNPDPDAAPLAETLGDLPRSSPGAASTSRTLRFHSHHEWPIEANWKVALENYLECYHCPVAHPGFSKVIDVDPDSYALSVSPTFSSQIGPIRASALSGNGSAPYVPEGDVTQSQYHFLWPNTTINIAPGPQNISLERWVPDGTGSHDRGDGLLVRRRRPRRDRAGGARVRRAGRAGGHRSRRSRCRPGSTRAPSRRDG